MANFEEEKAEDLRRLEVFFANQENHTFVIQDTCKRQNNAVLKLELVRKPTLDKCLKSGFVSFIPAAGASSRWIEIFGPLVKAVASRDLESIEQEIASLRKIDLKQIPLPKTLRELLDLSAEGLLLNRQALIDTIEWPKALYAARIDGTSFLEIKSQEDERIDQIQGQIVICPENKRKMFSDHHFSWKDKYSKPIYFLEQGSELATIRYRRDLSPWRDDLGQVSRVSAGHGALINLIPDVSHFFPEAHSIFIRNVDNAYGDSEDCVSTTKSFFDFHATILSFVMKMRIELERHSFDALEKIAAELLECLGYKAENSKSSLAFVFESIFHVPVSKDIEPLVTKVLHRPVVTMGMVPNNGTDVGGTPVFAVVNGKVQKLCLEVPHASIEDQEVFLRNPLKATHFNPVFCCVEIFSKDKLAFWNGHPFWLVAKKRWRNEDVFYPESILYEMIGSSFYTNLIFVEVPRLVFKPHKSISAQPLNS